MLYSSNSISINVLHSYSLMENQDSYLLMKNQAEGINKNQDGT